MKIILYTSRKKFGVWVRVNIPYSLKLHVIDSSGAFNTVGV